MFNTTHQEMLDASILSFNKGDSSSFVKIFSKAVTQLDEILYRDSDMLSILTSDDLTIINLSNYDYYGYNEHEHADIYTDIYQAKILEMNAKKRILDAKASLQSHNSTIKPSKSICEMSFEELTSIAKQKATMSHDNAPKSRQKQLSNNQDEPK